MIGLAAWVQRAKEWYRPIREPRGWRVIDEPDDLPSAEAITKALDPFQPGYEFRDDSDGVWTVVGVACSEDALLLRPKAWLTVNGYSGPVSGMAPFVLARAVFWKEGPTWQASADDLHDFEPVTS